MERRIIRGKVTEDIICKYLDKYSDFIKNIDIDNSYPVREDEKIFSFWIQGEDNAPKVIKTCWNSIRANCPQELVILDKDTVSQWIDLPEDIISKWESGKIRPAHFADIVRLALLERHGGLWLDATDYVPAPLPEWLWNEDFFVYMSGEIQRGWYSFIQNCFIRGRKGNFLVSAWLKLILEYWRREDKAIDYFVHQLLFKKLVEGNVKGAEEFKKMPIILQDSTHSVWFEHGNDMFNTQSWAKMISAAMFQKTEYKSNKAKRPKVGSNAAHLIESY